MRKLRSTCRVAALPSALGGREKVVQTQPPVRAADSSSAIPLRRWCVERRPYVATGGHYVVARQHRVRPRPGERRQPRRIGLCAIVVPDHEVPVARISGQCALHQRVVERRVIDHQIYHQVGEFAGQRFDVSPGAVARIDGAIVLHRKTAVGVPRRERQQVQSVDSVRQIAPHESPQGGQRRSAVAADRIGVCDQGHVAGRGHPHGARCRGRLGRLGRLGFGRRAGRRVGQAVAIPQCLQLRERAIRKAAVEMPEIGLQAARNAHCDGPSPPPCCAGRSPCMPRAATVAVVTPPL